MTQQTPAGKPFYKKRSFIILAVIVGLGVIGQFNQTEAPAPKPVVKNAYDIKPNIFYDDEQKAWAWTPIFKWPVSPKTRMTCEVAGLDKDGKQVAADTFDANTLNDGTVIYYGEIRNDYTTKAIAESIVDYTIKCDK